MGDHRTDPADGPTPRIALITFGHSTADPARWLDSSGKAGVTAVVDARTAPGSRRHPDLSRQRVGQWTPEEHIAHRWEPRLGGFRKPPPDSPDRAWRNASFPGMPLIPAAPSSSPPWTPSCTKRAWSAPR